MSTRVCRLHGQGDVRIEEAPLAPPAAGEVLVRLAAGGICGSDLHYLLDGGFGPIRVREPIILGHEAAGVVEAAGEGAALAPGTRVALNPSRPCNLCRFCRLGLRQHCLEMRFSGSAMRMPHEHGFFRDRIVLPAGQCHPLPPDADLAAAACAEPLAVCLHAVAQAPALTGAEVLVTGAGPIGALCVAVARAAGAGRVVATDLHELPLAVARRMGAHEALNVRAQPQALAGLAAGKGSFDVVFECSAAAEALRSALDCVRPRGTIVQLGLAGDLPVPVNALVGKEIRLVGSYRFDAEYEAAVAAITTGRIDVRPIVTATFPLAEAKAAFACAADRRGAVKVQLAF